MVAHCHHVTDVYRVYMPQVIAGLDASIEAARCFLLQRRDSDGLWCDFDLPRGRSDEWVSAYIGMALAERAGSQDTLQSVLDILCSRRSDDEGWGYSAHTPPDADSTAWVCRLAHLVGRVDAYSRGIRFIKRCLHGNGGVATYDSPVAIRQFLGSPPISLRGWCSPHVCVTAGAALLPDVANLRPVREFLRNSQERGGNWHAYWWCDSEYATSLAVEAIRAWRTTEDLARIEHAANWAAKSIQEASPFCIACRIQILSACYPSMATNLAKHLITLQQPDGSWRSSARLRLPRPDIIDVESFTDWRLEEKSFGSVFLDSARLYTTATALRALNLCCDVVA